jgi:hypothetical protein
MVTILGGTLVAIGAFVLVLVDGPRVFRRVGRIALRRRNDSKTPAPDGEGQQVAEPGSDVRPEEGPVRGPAEAAYRGLEPGWYRDRDDPAMARYWDGSTLGTELRRVAEPETARHT